MEHALQNMVSLFVTLTVFVGKKSALLKTEGKGAEV